MTIETYICGEPPNDRPLKRIVECPFCGAEIPRREGCSWAVHWREQCPANDQEAGRDE